MKLGTVKGYTVGGSLTSFHYTTKLNIDNKQHARVEPDMTNNKQTTTTRRASAALAQAEGAGV